MSEGDVSLIRDEDLLRRMWQQTEDFSRKKEIRAHMYRLREERLRDLYSPEPTRDGKGSEFSAAQGHVKSFADQTFQSMKSKEVRDAGSPPKEFTYRGQDLKALSNAGWNVESENKTTDDGHTHVKSVHANIEGRYDVDGGKGQFAAVDHHKEAVTEYHDDHSSLKRNQTSSNTAAREYVVRNTDDGTQVSSTTSSSTSSSKFQQMSSTRHDTVPYLTNDDYDLRSYDTNRNEDTSSVTKRQIIQTNDYDQSTKNDYEQNVRKNEYQQHVNRNDYEQNITKNNYEHSVKKNNYEQTVSRNDYETGELVSRKIDYPDDNTRVIVETRCLPDGTRVTSTKREFRAPVQSTRSEQSYQVRENKSYSSQQRSDVKESSKTTQRITDNRVTDIVDSQRNVDDYDFKKQIADYTKDNEDHSDVKRYETKINKRVVDHSNADDNYSQTTRHVTKVTQEVTDNKDYVQRQQRTNQTHHRQYVTNDQRETVTRDTKTDTSTPRSDRPDTLAPQKERPESLTPRRDYPETTKPRDDNQDTINRSDNRPLQQKDYIHQETRNTEEKIHHIKKENKVEETVERKTSTDRYQTTYQTDFPQKKISNDWSPSHQAWASTLRADTPTTTRPSTRASSPGSKTFKSSTSSLRSSVSPDKITRKPSSRGGSPSKIDRSSPTRTVVDKHSTTHSTHSVTEIKTHKNTTPEDKRPPTGRSPTRHGYSPERKPQDHRQRPSVSPEKRPQNLPFRPSVSPDRKPAYRASPTDAYPRTSSPSRPLDREESPTRPRASPERKLPHKATPTEKHHRTSSPIRPLDREEYPTRPRASPERKPSRPVDRDESLRPRASPDRKLPHKATSTDQFPRTSSPTRPLDRGESPTRPRASPERKPAQKATPTDKYPRTSSPTRPLDLDESPTRPRASPERKPSRPLDRDESPTQPRVSPERKPSQKATPTDKYPRTSSPTRPLDRSNSPTHPYNTPKDTFITPGQIPERKHPYGGQPGSHLPRNISPARPYPSESKVRPGEVRESPDRKPESTSPATDDMSPKRGSVSPDRKPGYMRPTSASRPSDNLKDRTSPTKQVPSQSPERKPQDNSKTTTKVQEDHYKFIDEETKMYTRTEKTEITDSKHLPSGPARPTPKETPSKKSPTKNTPDFNDVTPSRSRSPSPKEHVTFTDQYNRVDITSTTNEEITTKYPASKDKDTPTDKKSPREPTPPKYGTYDKKKPYVNDDTEVVRRTVVTTEDNKYDSLTRREKSPTKTPTQPSSPTKKIPRNSVSPVKSPTKDSKYKHTTDFISTEQKTEEINKTISKEHPRQLITPSSSPTRKPKQPDTEPSTGQSSPTTSVSGFVYFSSPRNEKTVVTDLDEQEIYSETNVLDKTTTIYKRPESLSVNRPQSPTKIPCRSPSPEKRVSPPKDSLPRKSSLKKPSTEITQASPIEKPPSSFSVSPTEDSKEFPDHKIVKKDHPETPEPDTPTSKQKPPLERRETYEDRCRKILGMMDDTTTTNVTKKTSYLKEPETNLSSPSFSPCRSPALKETPFEYPSVKKTTKTKTDVTDFITHEQQNIVQMTTTHVDKLDDKKTKKPRGTSPTKLQDIITTEKNILKSDVTIKDTEEVKTLGTQKVPSPRKNPERKTPMSFDDNSVVHETTTTRSSPDRKPRFEPTMKKPEDRHPADSISVPQDFIETTSTVTTKDYISTKEKIVPPRCSESPTRKIVSDKPLKSGQPSDKSPERKPSVHKNIPTKTNPDYEEYTKEKSPSRPNYTKTTTSMVVEYDSTSPIDDVEEFSDLPTRQTPKTVNDTPTNHSYPSDKIPDRKTSHDKPAVRASPEKKPKESSPSRTGHKTNVTSVTEYDITSAVDLQENVTTDTVKTKKSPRETESPSRKSPKSTNDTPLHPTHTNRSPDRKTDRREKPSSLRYSPEKPYTDEYPNDDSPTELEKVPSYMKTTKSVTSKSDIVSTDIVKTKSLKTTEKHVPHRSSGSPTRETTEPKDYPRTSSPSRSTEPADRSPQRKPSKDEITPKKTTPEKPDLNKKEQSPTRMKPSPEKIPGYMKTTSSHVHKQDTLSMTKDITESRTIETIERTHDHPRPLSPSKQPTENNSYKKNESPDRKQRHPEPADKKSRENSPSKSSPDTPGYMRKTSASIRRVSEDHVETSSITIDSVSNKHHQQPPYSIPKHDDISPRASPDRHTRERIPKETSPVRKPGTTTTSKDIKKTATTQITEEDQSTRQHSSTSPTRNVSKPSDSSKPTLGSPIKELPSNRHSDVSMNKPSVPQGSPTKISNDNTTQQIPHRSSSSPDRKPSYKTSSNLKTTSTTEEIIITNVGERHPLPRSSESPTRHTSHEPSKFQPGYLQQPEEPRQLRTPSPTKKTTKITEISTDFITSEKEQEIMDRVQKSVRKLSPERKERSPSREKSPGKTTTSLQDINIITHTVTDDESISEDFTEISENSTVTKKYTRPVKPQDEKPKDHKVPIKQTTRTVSPTKKPSGLATPTKVDKSPDSPTKTRSVSPKKPISSTERPQSPQISKPSGIKPKEQIPSHLTRKPTPATLNVSKVDKTEVKKSTNISSITKQNSFTRTTNANKTTTKSIPSPTGRPNEPETRRVPTPKGIRESTIPTRKDNDTKVTRTSSDLTMKTKKISPQRMKSKPEIQVSDMSTKSTLKTTKSIKEPHSKLPTKPKSATTLNTSTDEDDIIVDVEQSKSSRENSPDRICPTPVNFTEDIGTPRYPDEVSEPDDEFRRRTHHTIHEAESIVDDIVEICEDDELFVRKTDVDVVTEEDESLLSVTDKVSRFTKGVNTINKSKDTTTIFKETEKRVHSDFMDDKLKSDECLLSVSEKVNKFAKGPKDTRESKSPSRRVTDEYDKNTVYQDDYTKLSVHDKAHLFVETAENVKIPKVKPTPQRVERPDLSNVDDSLKSDDCLLSVSDKVHKFVKTAEQFLTESHEVEEKDKKIKEQHEKIMRKIVTDVDDDEQDIERTIITEDIDVTDKILPNQRDEKIKPKEITSSLPKIKDYSNTNIKPNERTPTVKITTLRSSEAVKKAKALFENIATTTQKPKETSQVKTTKLTDIGVIKKSPKTDSTTVLHPTVEDESPNVTDVDSEVGHPQKDRPTSGTTTRPRYPQSDDDKPRSSPSRLNVQPADVSRSKSPMRQTVETTTTTKTVVSRYPVSRPERAESPRQRPEAEKPDKIPGYLRPTKTSQIKEETKVVEDTEVSSRRGSGKFGIELRRTSVERSTASSERRRSVEHPCIEDIYDLDLLEQMLEKVVGYEQRRRIRSQIRIAKKKVETEHTDTNTYTKTTRQTVTTQKLRSPERQHTRSPERNAPKATTHKDTSPDRHAKTPQRTIPERTQPREQVQPVLNGHSKEPNNVLSDRRPRPHSPEKPSTKSVPKSKSPARQPSPDKKTRTRSPSKTAASKPKPNRFNEYASAYMKKVGLSEADKIRFAEAKSKKTAEENQRTVKHTEHKIVEEYSTAKSFTDKVVSEDMIEVVQLNGNNKRSPSPEKRQSPERKAHSPERIYERTPSPSQKQIRSEPAKKETIIKTVYEIEKKIPQKQVQEEKPSWVTNRNLKKINSETRTFSSKKIEEKPKYRAPSPSKAITKPIDVITSSYGPGPLDADGKPLFGIRALRNGASNYQVKGTVIRQEYHSRNGGEPEGTVSVTAYSTEPEDLERLLQGQGEPPSRIHGLAAITTTKKFGGDTGTTLKEAHGREDRAAIDQFTHSDRRVSDTRVEDITERSTNRREEIVGETRRIESRREEIIGDRSRQARGEIIDSSKDRREDKSDRMQRRVEKVEKKGDRTQERRERIERTDDKKTVRQSSVKSLTEKYIKSANESSKAERTTYPKAGLILRTSTMKDSVSSDSSAHAGLTRTDSEHSLASVEDTVVTTSERVDGGVRTVTTTTRTHGSTTHHSRPEKSFLDSNTKVTGVQDILTRMKNADIVIQEGDTTEDAEARALLNKFLGATVLMAGMQNYVTEKPTGKVVVKQETVRTSSSGGGKVTSTQTRSIEDFDVDQCWDERLLRKLLDECNDYEQRRRLRARIRNLMAEQEACASAVTEALAAAGEAEGAEGDSRGESLLLPLLQGLLGGGGERLLAGLGAAPADVVADVRRSLGRLRAALAPPTEHPQARALLSLADRLEDALDAADRLDGCRRKPRRRSRAARHTVGVTHEELEEARRLVDRDQLALGAKGPSSSGATSTASMATSTDEPSTPERKQSIDENVSYHDAVASRQKSTPVAHSVSYEAPKLNRDAHVVVEKRAPTTRKPDFYRHSVADTGSQRTQPHQQMQPLQQPQQQLQQQAPQPPPAQGPQHAPHVPYQPQPLYQPYQPQPRMERRPSDSKSSIAAIANKFDSRAQKENIPRRAPIEPVNTQQKEFNKRAPLYMPLPPTYNFAAPPIASQDDSKPLNRFGNSNNKRLRMKRANTIDIGRPLAGYRIDSDNDDESSPRPIVPEFTPQTENDRKFVAFMKKNEAADRESSINGPANWSSRFGNIKNAFESREREDTINMNSRSSSASSARRFWRTADETTVNPASARPRKFFNANNNDIVKPPWVNERREPMRVHIPRQVQQPPAPATAPVSLPTHRPAPIAAPTSAPILPPAPAPAVLTTPVAPPHHPPVPQSPTKPLVVKPFVARPIPINQFSHAPMSAFKPPTKVTSPTTAPAYIWSPPSVMNVTSPPVDHTPAFPVNPGPIAPSPPAPSKPWASDVDKPRRVVGIAATKFETNKPDLAPAPYRERPSAFHPPAPQTHAPLQMQNYPMKTIPSQNDLSAPELVRKAEDTKPPPQDSYLPKVDAQKLQIEFYEKQIREKNRRETVTNGHSDPMERKPPAPPAYTITDYTPSNGISTFVPLQRTPDIEKARAHKVDYLPDVVTNETDRHRNGASPLQGRAPTSPYSPRATNITESPHAYQNGDVPYTNGVDEGVTTEHDSVVTRVMRGPVRGAATITTGVRTRNDEGRRGSAADSLRGALDKFSSPKNDVINQIERKKRETARSQVRAPVNTGRSPLLAPASPHAPHSPGGLAASRESVLSSESAGSLGSNPLSRSGSWHQMVASPKSASPRRVVARAKSMHLLAVPKLYEGGIAREEVTEKKRTVEAYFSGQQPQPARPTPASSSRPRALRQSYAPPQPYSLGRSRTMPTVSELQFLDESNTEDAFEDLVSALA